MQLLNARRSLGRVASEPFAGHGHPHSVRLTIPPLAVLYLVPEA